MTKNYRPISITSCIPKILDAIVANRLSEFLVNKIIGEQHGFTKNKSTLSNLLVYTNCITQAFTDLQQVDSIYLDFSKAFDSVNHTLLVNKVKCMGLGVTLTMVRVISN